MIDAKSKAQIWAKRNIVMVLNRPTLLAIELVLLLILTILIGRVPLVWLVLGYIGVAMIIPCGLYARSRIISPKGSQGLHVIHKGFLYLLDVVLLCLVFYVLYCRVVAPY